MLAVEHEQQSHPHQTSELGKKPNLFIAIPMVIAKTAYDDYLAALNEPLTKQQEKFVIFLDELQKEALGVEQERELWFNYQLIIAYISANQWEYALQAIDDALLLTANLDEDDNIFINLLNQVLANIENSG
jgi:hypothetical protein